jgi:two-component system, chemotaxis family, chemotaxis protein CheY
VTDGPVGKPKNRLLAVDDNLDSAELVRRIAERSGYEARTASTLPEIRSQIVEWRPDVLTLDLCMPDSDGIDLMELLHQANFTGRLIIVSGHDPWLLRSARRLATARGFDVVDDIRKPLDPTRFRQLLETLNPPSDAAA